MRIKIFRGYLWRSLILISVKLLRLCLVAGIQFHFFINFAFFEKRFFKEMSWITVSTSDFYLFVFNILTFSGITLSITFEIARNLYRRCKSVVYGSYGPPVGSLVITYEVKVSCNFYLLIYLFFWSHGPKLPKNVVPNSEASEVAARLKTN